MKRPRPPVLAAILLSSIVPTVAKARAQGAAEHRPLRGLLIHADMATPQGLSDWKAEGGTAVVVVLDESFPRERWSDLASGAARAGLSLYEWVEVARNPAMAESHPEWMASPGAHHDDWRRRFPDAPRAGPGEAVKLWPWVPLGYAPAYEAHRRRIESLLDPLPGPWAGVFLNDLQAGPSSCGCGNDQCRWALDYGSKPTAPPTPGGDPAARLVAEVQDRHPDKAVIPVWVTECEPVDLPGIAGGTGHCGSVSCARGACWPNYKRSWDALIRSARGPVAVGLWAESFHRDPSWIPVGLELFLRPPQGDALPPERAIAFVPARGGNSSELHALKERLMKPGRGGWVLAKTPPDQSWEPRLIKVPR